MTQPEDFGLNHLLDVPEDVAGEEQESTSEAADAYGSTYEDFKKTGRFGSPECYTLFRSELESILADMHRGTRHMGKFPSGYDAENVAVYSDLRKELQKAVKEERFEDAALLRDKLEAIKDSFSPRKKV